jgi:hypothetical protein
MRRSTEKKLKHGSVNSRLKFLKGMCRQYGAVDFKCSEERKPNGKTKRIFTAYFSDSQQRINFSKNYDIFEKTRQQMPNADYYLEKIGNISFFARVIQIKKPECRSCFRELEIGNNFTMYRRKRCDYICTPCVNMKKREWRKNNEDQKTKNREHNKAHYRKKKLKKSQTTSSSQGRPGVETP